jgi:hypothetical protein
MHACMHIEVKVHPYLAVIRLHLDWLHAHVLAVRSDECLIFPMLYMCMPSQQMGPDQDQENLSTRILQCLELIISCL